MDANRYWPVVVENRSGERIRCVIGYPQRPSDEIAAGLIRPLLGMGMALPDHLRYQEGACQAALKAAGYRLIEIGENP